jgi:hypothetical protein
MSPDEPTTQELKALQTDRERAEREMAETASEEAEKRTHKRRADRASYLADKLREQAEKPDA